MKHIFQYALSAVILLFALSSCEEDEFRTHYPHSTPKIESAAINPSTITYGDSVSITATVSDPSTPLSTMEMKMVVNDKIVAQQIIRTPGTNATVTQKFLVPFLSELPNNADVEVQLKLINVEGDETSGSISGVKGMRRYYSKLYLVLDDGNVVNLSPLGSQSDSYESSDVKLSNSIRYKVASKITSGNQIDFSGDVWGWKDGEIQLVDESGDYITTTEPLLKETEQIIFDTYTFTTDLVGEELVNVSSLSISMFKDATIGGEAFKIGNFYIEKNKNLKIDSELAQAVFNMDYFERVAEDSVKFLGETGPWKLDYNPTRKYVLVEDPDPSYPNVLLITGEGLGYPSKAKPGATTSWGFDQAMQYILCRKVGDDIYQSTIYMDAVKANFKYFENKGWGNEKRSEEYTLPAIFKASPSDGNWFAADDAVSGTYKVTIDLATKVVIAEAVTIP